MNVLCVFVYICICGRFLCSSECPVRRDVLKLVLPSYLARHPSHSHLVCLAYLCTYSLLFVVFRHNNLIELIGLIESFSKKCSLCSQLKSALHSGRQAGNENHPPFMERLRITMGELISRKSRRRNCPRRTLPRRRCRRRRRRRRRRPAAERVRPQLHSRSPSSVS